MRSDELSREESFLNSTPPSLSSLNSKQHSSTNLHKAAMTNNNSPSDIKQKFNLSAEIRDRLLLQDDYSSTSSVAGSMEDASSEGSNENSSKPKKLIGKMIFQMFISYLYLLYILIITFYLYGSVLVANFACVTQYH